MSRRPGAGLLREVALTTGALLGVLCILATVASALFGVRPLVFQSGSMAPSIQTGDLALARTVPAASLAEGDVVSVLTVTGERVTHRVVGLAPVEGAHRLTLRGDANETVDAETYTVTSAEKVLFHVPKAGFVVAAASSSVGVFVLGLGVAGLLVLAFGPGSRRDEDDDPPPSGGRRRGGRRRARRSARAAVAGGVAVAALVASPAIAAPWTDDVPVTGTTFAAATVTAATSVGCESGASFSGSVNVTWNHGSPDPEHFEVRAIKTNGANAGSELVSKNVAGTARTVNLSRTDIPAAGLGDVWVVLYFLYNYRVEVTAVYAGGWRSATATRSGFERTSASSGHTCS